MEEKYYINKCWNPNPLSNNDKIPLEIISYQG